ncbi:hypothetical protein [Streptomyces sp. NPDC001508]
MQDLSERFPVDLGRHLLVAHRSTAFARRARNCAGFARRAPRVS